MAEKIHLGMPPEPPEMAPEEESSPIERIKRAREAIKTGENLGIAFGLIGKLEALTQFAEKHPLESGGILQKFEELERAMNNIGKDGRKIDIFNKWVSNECTPWVNRAFEEMERRTSEKTS